MIIMLPRSRTYKTQRGKAYTCTNYYLKKKHFPSYLYLINIGKPKRPWHTLEIYIINRCARGNVWDLTLAGSMRSLRSLLSTSKVLLSDGSYLFSLTLLSRSEISSLLSLFSVSQDLLCGGSMRSDLFSNQ